MGSTIISLLSWSSVSKLLANVDFPDPDKPVDKASKFFCLLIFSLFSRSIL